MIDHPRTTEPATCKRCGETKPASQFHSCGTKKNGLSSYCKPCASAAVSACRWKRVMKQELDELGATTENHTPQMELNVKRLQLPDTYIHVRCPRCDVEGRWALVDQISYPELNQPGAETIYAFCNECGEEWDVPITISLSVRVARA